VSASLSPEADSPLTLFSLTHWEEGSAHVQTWYLASPSASSEHNAPVRFRRSECFHRDKHVRWKRLESERIQYNSPVGRQGTEGRNVILGFGLSQVDLSVDRKFRIGEKLNLQFRADASMLLTIPTSRIPLE